MAKQTGSTTAAVNVRSGAGTQFPRMYALPPKASVEILGEEGEWYHVAAAGQQGYVHKKLIILSTQGVADGFLKDKVEPAPTPGQPAVEAAPTGHDLENVPLEPPADQRMPVNPKAPLLERLSADIWNRFGGLLTSLSNELKIDPGVAVAVLAVESGGKGFGPDGRMIIRFENQVFYDRWAKPTNQKDRYFQHFNFNQEKRWIDHVWRADPNGAWEEFHGAGNQPKEWAVFKFACTLDDTAAKKSISMGGPQIMGFNHIALGFESVQQMFDSFSASERNQLIGFFDFVQGPAATSRQMLALQQEDFDTFASVYNGPGQAAKYGGLIRGTVAAFHRMRGS